MTNKNRILYFGTWGLGYAGLNALFELENIEVVKVYSKWDLKIENDYYNQVFNFCKEKEIDIFNCDKNICSKDIFIKDVLENKEIDFIVTCSFDRILTDRILELPIQMAINVHPSNLPKFRGPFPLPNAIICNEKVIGVTIHELSKEIDAGDILLQETSVAISPNDKFSKLMERQKDVAQKLLKEFFGDFKKYISSKRKQSNEISFAPRLDFKISDNDFVWEIQKKHFDSIKNKING
jgi:methionyl-tRNA formyltransferase